MDPTVERLLRAFSEVLAAADLSPEGSAGSEGETISDVSEVADLFATMNGTPCPPSMRPGLVLPSEIAVRWHYDRNVSGEVNIPSLLSAMHGKLDPSLENTVIGGRRLGDMRIADAVLVQAGPIHVLFEVKGGGMSDKLFLFDSREIWPLELAYDAYLQMAAATRGVVFWQLLFRAGRLPPAEAQVLSAEIAFLERRFPTPELKDLRRRLRARSG